MTNAAVTSAPPVLRETNDAIAILTLSGGCTFAPIAAHGGGDDQGPAPDAPVAAPRACDLADSSLVLCLDFDDVRLGLDAIDGLLHHAAPTPLRFPPAVANALYLAHASDTSDRQELASITRA